jgi:hypothetical protein
LKGIWCRWRSFERPHRPDLSISKLQARSLPLRHYALIPRGKKLLTSLTQL